MEHADLVARSEIQQVIVRLARGTDRRDAELMADCYHPGATDDHNFFHGPARELVELVMSADPSEWTACSHTTSPALIEISGKKAWAETSAVAHHVALRPDGQEPRYFVIGARYEDAFERRDGRWRIVHRAVIYDWAGELALTAGDRASRQMPFPEAFNTGRRDASDPSFGLRLRALD